MNDTADPQQRLSAALGRVIAQRRVLRADPQHVERWFAVKQWQSARLRQTYDDLFAQARYRQAGEFFLNELYGTKDFEQRDQEALRVAPKLARLLPHRAVETIALAVELDELSETLDARVATVATLPLTAERYAQAYVQAGTPEERALQIDRVDQVGRALEKLAKVPLLAGMLHLMRGPAEAAGLLHLHHFLQAGFDAFKAMGSASTFLDTIRKRETVLMQRLFAGDRDPFYGV